MKERAWVKLKAKTIIKVIVILFILIVTGIIADFYNLTGSFGITSSPSGLKSSPSDPNKADDINFPEIVYGKCGGFPKAPADLEWPEDEFLDEAEIISILDLPDPTKSKVWIGGSPNLAVGDTIKIEVVLFDGRNERRQLGGDLVRVWLKDDTTGGKTTASVIDNKDGSYTAFATLFWEGAPEVKVAIISPREVIAEAFKRRYICPPIMTNTAVFEHPVIEHLREVTPCNYDSHIPAYTDVCNFTHDNYGRPWYCGKPRNGKLQCHDWTMTSELNLWNAGIENTRLSYLERQLLDLRYLAMMVPTNLVLTVTKGKNGESTIIPNQDCSNVSYSKTWNMDSPTGYFHQGTWTYNHCKSSLDQLALLSCLENITVFLIGDSTVRQFFYRMEEILPCTWTTDTWFESGKNRPVVCENRAMNFSLVWNHHQLPYVATDAPRSYFKSFRATFNEIPRDRKVVVLVHFYAHLLNYHSHVFYETLLDFKQAVIKLINENRDVSIVIKGPHAYSFAKVPDHVLWMPDVYTRIYQEWIQREFKDLSEKIVYLETLDMTICTEQWHIHSERYIIKNIVDQMFSYICVKNKNDS